MEEKKQFNQIKYIQDYNKKNYKTYTIRVKSDLQLYLEEYCEKYNKSMQGLFLEAVKDFTGYMGDWFIFDLQAF